MAEEKSYYNEDEEIDVEDEAYDEDEIEEDDENEDNADDVNDGLSKFLNIDDLDDIPEELLRKLKTGGGGGNSRPSLSVVHNKNGKRVRFSKKLFEELGSPESISIKIQGNKLYVASDFDNAKKFQFSPDPELHVIYKGGLATILKEYFKLNFSEKTSYSFQDIDFDSYRNSKYKTIDVAIINMSNPVNK